MEISADTGTKIATWDAAAGTSSNIYVSHRNAHPATSCVYVR